MSFSPFPLLNGLLASPPFPTQIGWVISLYDDSIMSTQGRIRSSFHLLMHKSRKDPALPLEEGAHKKRVRFLLLRAKIYTRGAKRPSTQGDGDYNSCPHHQSRSTRRHSVHAAHIAVVQRRQAAHSTLLPRRYGGDRDPPVLSVPVVISLLHQRQRTHGSFLSRMTPPHA